MAVVPVLTLITRALKGIGVYGPGEPIKQADAADVLDALNLILDDWGADPQASVAEVFTAFTTTGVNPQTIGPTGQWVLPVRPVAIDALSWLVTSPGVYSPITVHTDPRWWNQQTVLNPGTLTDAFYSADLPNGSIYFSGVPASGTTVRVMTRTALAAVSQTASLTLAPGYQNALELTLMEAIADPFHMTLTDKQIVRAGKARALIFGNNLRVPTLSTRGLGLPSVSRGRWDYRTGTWVA